MSDNNRLCWFDLDAICQKIVREAELVVDGNPSLHFSDVDVALFKACQAKMTELRGE